MNILYYHTTLLRDMSWLDILLEQAACMEAAGMELDRIRLNAVYYDKKLFDQFIEIAAGEFDRIFPRAGITLNGFDTPFTSDEHMMARLEGEHALTENATMRMIHDECVRRWYDTDKICYVHAKGALARNRLMTGKLGTVDYARYRGWRELLNWGVITKWQECLQALDADFDVAGINFRDDISPHFSGNFWWTSVRYIKELPSPYTTAWWHKLQSETTNAWLKTCSERYRDEHWLFAKRDLTVFCPGWPENNPAGGFISMRDYR